MHFCFYLKNAKVNGSLQQPPCHWHGPGDTDFEELEDNTYFYQHAKGSFAESLLQSIGQIMTDNKLGLKSNHKPWFEAAIWYDSLKQEAFVTFQLCGLRRTNCVFLVESIF